MNCDLDDNISLGYCSDVPQYSPDSFNITWPSPDPNNEALVEFIEQPADYRYRYLKEKYHGHIVGVSSPATKKKDMLIFPKVKLSNYNGSAIIRVWLITTDLSGKPQAHFHKLARKLPKGEINHEPHDFIASVKNNFEVTLDYLHIIHAVTSDKNDIDVYRQKKTHIDSGVYDPPKTLPTSTKEEKNEIKQIDKNQSVFYVQVFDERTHTKIADMVSRKIMNLHNAETGILKIVNYSKTYGTCRGDDEVFIFVEKISKDVEVRFFKNDSNEKRIWEDLAIFSPQNVHHQLGIVFKTPRYYQDIKKDTQVFFELHRKTDGAVSDPVPFTYKPHEEYRSYHTAKKRPHTPETCLEDPYVSPFVASYTPKRIKEESMSPDSTSLTQQYLENIPEIPVGAYSFNPDSLIFSTIGDQTLLCDEFNLTVNENECFPDLNSLLDEDNAGVLQFDGISSSKGFVDTCQQTGESEIEIRTSDKPDSNGVLVHDNIPDTGEVPRSPRDTNKLSRLAKVNLQSAIIQQKSVQEIIEILKHIDNINDVDYEGNSALHYAVTLSAEYLEPILVRQDINRNIRNLGGDDVVLYAARHGNVPAMEVLLEKNFDPNIQNSRTGETPLHLAISDDNYDMVDLLLKYEADPLINNYGNQSAYEYSINYGVEIRQLIHISMQKNMFPKRIDASAVQPESSVENDLVSKLNELEMSSSKYQFQKNN